jgi:hypothetical protein
MSKDFKLWLEFEEVDPATWDTQNDFCNIQVYLPDGRHYGINVWTYQYLQTSIEQDKASGNNLNGIYQIPPDLLVQELSRECLEKVIADILTIGDLEKVLNPSVYDQSEQSQ